MPRTIKNGVIATVKILCQDNSWHNISTIFNNCYNKYNTFEMSDVAKVMETLVSTGEAKSKIVADEKQYQIRTHKFEILLENAKISRYHLSDTTGISEDKMKEYCNGNLLTASDAIKIAASSRISIQSLSEITRNASVESLKRKLYWAEQEQLMF